MRGVGRIDDLDLSMGVLHPGFLELGLHILRPTHDERLAQPGALIHHRSAQHARIVALGEDHPRLVGPGARIDAPQDAGGRVHPGFQRHLIGIHVDDRTAGGPGVHPGLGHGGRNTVRSGAGSKGVGMM